MVRAIEERRKELVDLRRKHHVKQLDVFGSAATGELGEASDIDFLVEFEDNLVSGRFDNFFDLQHALAKLFGRNVDLVERGGLRNPYFIRRLNQTSEPVYVRS